MGVAIQILCSSLICCLCLCMGIMFAWPSSTLRLFESQHTTLHRPMTDTELILFGSLSSVGAMIGTPIVGSLLDRIGRKNCAILFSSIDAISWSIIAVCNRVEVVLTAVFVSGLSGAAFLIAPVFVSEICQESIRGAMSSGSMVFYAMGMLVSYLLGGSLKYHTMVYVALTINAVVTAALVLLKESPTHLMARGLEEQAAKSIAFYRRVKTTSKEVQEELNVIRQCLNPELDTTPEEENLKGERQESMKLGIWQFIKKSSSTRRGIVVTVVLLTASIFQGMVVLQVYAEPLFEEALPGFSANLASILLASVTVLSGFVAAYLTEKAGRRPLMIYSTVATTASSLLLGLQLHLRCGPTWLLALNIYFFSAVFACGGGTVPYVLLAEVFLPQVKSVVTMLVVEWSWFCNYLILFMFKPLLATLGLGPVFYVFTAVGLLLTLYSLYYMPETKGLTVYDIQTKLTNKRASNTDC